ncbi:hypothetical protein AX279_22320 [Pseudomonas sp. J237]|nr:hypothetical protein AX279_22320 [Pseudomonas sp. J237]
MSSQHSKYKVLFFYPIASSLYWSFLFHYYEDNKNMTYSRHYLPKLYWQTLERNEKEVVWPKLLQSI